MLPSNLTSEEGGGIKMLPSNLTSEEGGGISVFLPLRESC